MKYLSAILCLILLFSCGSGTDSTSKSDPEDVWAGVEFKPIPIPEGTQGESSLTRNLYIIMDGSGSMHDPLSESCSSTKRFATKMEGAKWALLQFLDSVPDDVNLGMYLFDNNGQREVVALGSNNVDAVRTAINGIYEGGNTPLSEAISLATTRLVKQYQKQLGYGEFRIIVVTDGIASRIPTAAVYAAENGIPIYTIGLCVGQDHPLRKYSVSYKAADNFEELAEGLKDTLAELDQFDPSEFEENAGTTPEQTN